MEDFIGDEIFEDPRSANRPADYPEDHKPWPWLRKAALAALATLAFGAVVWVAACV